MRKFGRPKIGGREGQPVRGNGRAPVWGRGLNQVEVKGSGFKVMAAGFSLLAAGRQPEAQKS